MEASVHQQRQLWPRIALPIGIVGLILLIMVSSSGTSASPVPDFTAVTLRGETVRLSDYKGQVVMLNFWATWCPPCKAEMPDIQAAYQSYKDRGFTVLAINNSERSPQIRPFVDAFALTFPIVLDSTSTLQESFAIKGYPTSLFISDVGELYATHTGMLTPEQLDGYITVGLAKIKSKPSA